MVDENVLRVLKLQADYRESGRQAGYNFTSSSLFVYFICCTDESHKLSEI